jgi:UDP-N-acetyl-D-glucosamine dehydrogenase
VSEKEPVLVHSAFYDISNQTEQPMTQLIKQKEEEEKNESGESVLDVSVCPAGEAFPIPAEKDYEKEFIRLKTLVEEQRGLGREIVVVMGVGFVGAFMAGVVADSTNRETDSPCYFVIGMQRPSPRSYWKIPHLNRGLSPVEAEDPEVAPLIKRCVQEKKTLTATFTYEALRLADVVVVDVQCDYEKKDLGDVQTGSADIAALESSLKVIGEKIDPGCLVLIETTVPPGTTEYIAHPIIKKAFEARRITDTAPLLAHSFERVMPGRNMLPPSAISGVFAAELTKAPGNASSSFCPVC